MDWIPRNYEDMVSRLDLALDDLDAGMLRLKVTEILEVLSGDAPDGEAVEACRQLARTGRVPYGLPDRIKLQVSLRVRCARWYCGDMSDRPYDDGRTAAECLESLMTEYWADIGRFDWIQEDLLGGDDFSGNGPILPE